MKQSPVHLSRATARIVTRTVAALAVVGLAGSLLAACSSDAAPGAGASDDFGAAVSAAAERVSDLKNPIDDVDLDVPALPSGSTNLSGKTIMLIPLATTIFANVIDAIESALAPTGATLTVCDGQAQPTEIVNCMNNAVTLGVSGVITLAVSPGIASAGYAALDQAGIPTLSGWQPAEGTAETATLRFVDSSTALETALSRAVDYTVSTATAPRSTIFARVVDSGSTTQISDDVASYYASVCPGCTLIPVDTTSARIPDAASAISAQLLVNDEVDSIFAFNLDTLGTSIVDGIGSAGTVSSANVEVGGQGGSIQTLQLVSQGALDYVVLQSSDFMGWSISDAFLRLYTQEAAVEYPVVQRLFDSGNIGDITLDAAQASSFDWFGTPTFHQTFLSSWGLG
ncbi:sugar ABC transporter substrate-binding protein [Microbacterium sp.]|jgi:ABC-type sugar transport system substrate-binding protein|uniref:sugar ABC transporter substrate-binding protein n=1 Tax=Microbacterium sp. TaxID=51671 RepID=UPI0037CB6816